MTFIFILYIIEVVYILNFNYKDVLSRVLTCPKDGRAKSAISFWKKETILFRKLFNKFPDENFWSTLSLQDAPCKNGRVPSLAMFLDKKNRLWFKILYKKWKIFHYAPPKYKPYKFNKDITEPTKYPIDKKTIRTFFKK